MPHGNLYGVTATLKQLLRVNIWRLNGNQDVEVSDLPPEDAEKEGKTCVNLHLYHAIEDPSRRNNLPINDAAPYPISRSPLPLVLYYAMTAHGFAGELKNPAAAQFLMGLAMKSFHDFPLIDDRLALPGPPNGLPITILDLAMRGAQNKIAVVQRQLTPEESVSFWSAAQNHTARLTAFYEVRSFLMPPEADAGALPLVAAVALGVMPSPRPTLGAATSIQTVTLPALSGGATLSAPVTPAVAALGAGNHVTVGGEGLGDGSDAKILLGGAAEGVIDPTFNPAWAFELSGGKLEFDVQPSVAAEAPGGFTTLAIRPGLYSLAVRRENQLQTEGGATTLAPVESNRIPFAVGPAIAAVAIVGGRVRLTMAPGLDCTGPLNKAQLTIGGDLYKRVSGFTGNPALDAGSFIAQSATRYEAQPLFDPGDGATRMIRLGVNGIDAPPTWLEPQP